MIAGKTKSGFEYQISEKILKDYRYVRTIAKLQKGDNADKFIAFDEISTLLLGGKVEDLIKHVEGLNEGYAPLEAMAAESSRILRPAYYNVHIGEKIVRDADSREMIDLIMDSINVDFGYCYAGAKGSGLGQDNWFMYFDIFRTIGQQKNANFVSTYEKKGNGYEKRLADLLKAFDSINNG